MIGSKYENTTDRRLHVMLLIACCIMVIDYYPVFEKGNDPAVCLQLYAAKDDQLLTFYPGRLLVDSSFDVVPDILAPFFFKPFNINSADKETLMIVKGIGPKLSENIIRQRYLHGPFKTIDDLLKLKGVGPKRAKYFAQVFSFGELQ